MAAISSTRAQYAPGDGQGLAPALAIALVLHAVVLLGVGFSFTRAAPPLPSLDVTLVKHRSDTSPTHAEVMAQHDQEGSGSEAALSQMATPRPAPLADTQLNPAGAPPQPEHTQEAPSQPVLAVHLDGVSSHIEHREPVHTAAPAAQLPPGDDIASLQARLQEARLQYSRMPRVLRTTALSARAALHAAYLADWVERVEAVGNRHYPQQARQQRLYGDVQLAVTLLPDGSIAAIDILRSSGHAVLDQAAQDTLHRAAPFAPFPPDMAAQWDRFEIIRTWQYIPGHRLNTRE